MVDPLVITEKWIRDRLNLTIDTLEDVRSLALPGSYHEKITHLGRSLASFTRLKHLDLSRNAICSLEGLEHLRLLETLNLYYNNVPDLQELYKLRHNSNLKELDLRLNPITKNEPDYRLFIIHMLVKIRLLDDRPVRDSERKAALMHFDSSQAAELRHQEVISQSYDVEQDAIPKHIQSRKGLVNSLARPPVHIGSDETDQLLDLIAENEERLAPGRAHDSSGKKKQEVFKRQQRHHSTPKANNITTRPSAKLHSKSPASKRLMSSIPQHHPSATDGTVRTPHHMPTVNRTTPRSVTHHGGGDTSPSAVTINHEIRLRELFSILRGKDVAHWESNTALQSRLVEWLSQQSGRRETGVSQDEHVAGEVAAVVAKLEQKETELHEVSERLKEREMEAIVLGQKLQLQAEELAQLQLKQHQNNDPTTAELLHQAQADLSTLNEHVRNLQKENSSLIVQLNQQRENGSPVDPQLLERLQTENKLLRAEVDSLTQQSRQQQQGLSQVQELATMLQESHRSLVATNDHLLRELEEAKRRHKLELQQSHSNYEQLRQTVELIQET